MSSTTARADGITRTPAAPFEAARRSLTWPWLAVSLIAVAGLVLRFVGARGDLWLDEIWSFALLKPLGSIDQIFWRVNHDNNHFLNSVYLYLVGPDAPPLAQRGLSIALGVATIVAAAVAAAPRGRLAIIATSLLFAVSYPLVHYGSEARGYAGLVLFTVLSLVFLERSLDGRRYARTVLAIAMLFGMLSHLTMIFTGIVLVAWACWVVWLRTRKATGTFIEIWSIFRPTLVAVLPLAACVIVGARLYGVTVGGLSPFSPAAFAAGYGGMIRYLFGLPAWTNDWAGIGVCCALVCASAWIFRDRRASLYVIAIVGLPVLMWLARLPNLEFPRYFIVSATFMLLWVGELIGRGLAAGGRNRFLAAVGMAAIVLGSAVSLFSFYQSGRGSYAAMVEKMTRDGPATFSSNHDFRTPLVVDYFSERMGRQASFIPQGKMCAERPDWLILEGDMAEPLERFKGAFQCSLDYDRVDAASHWGLSGLSWSLYRRRG
ncbi:hypothetical protein [Mesorhizobium sp. B1-1-8]|uniref:hypothetical protein n=1 Tax=Mesorhizobium sp. B1-1-8 TaxID=2589976 RepID=UPI00112E4FEC|nr:hypothetical protein [Mesorhizobium sp. B1-1-8]UCI05551.1 hypothetical protein FJ974_17060 [Mesorhizobium sp. B1-1-8]